MEVKVYENPESCANAARRGASIKFAITDDAENTRQLGLASGGYHTDLVPTNATLIGAGKFFKVGTAINAEWGSHSCEEKFGYDKPSDPETANEVLENVRVAFVEWLDSV